MSSTNEFRTELEIVELTNGEVVLRSTEGQRQPLVTVRFSSEIRNFLGQSLGQIGKAMIGTGIELVGEIKNQHYVNDDNMANDENMDANRVLH